MTVASRNLQVITGRAAREGARERVCFAQKPTAATKKWLCEQTNNHSAAALHLVPRGRPQAALASQRCRSAMLSILHLGPNSAYASFGSAGLDGEPSTNKTVTCFRSPARLD